MSKKEYAELVGYFTVTIIGKAKGGKTRTIQTVRIGFCGYMNKKELAAARTVLAKHYKEVLSKDYPADYELEVRARVTTTECDWIMNGSKDEKADN